MRVLAVDDEPKALRTMERAILAADPSAEVVCFGKTSEALKYAEDVNIDVAFLDIQMAGMDGLALAKKLKDIYGDTNIIFTTGYSEYAKDAFELRASGYILKPADAKRVKLELENLRNPIRPADEGIRIQCFGNFEVFVDGRPISFSRTRSKEALAYLVDRNGASVSNKELAAVLWEDGQYDRSRQKQLDVYISEMFRSLASAGAESLVIKEQRGSYAIDVSKADCDYYRSLRGDMQALNSYQGEYMSNYSWAEFTIGRLTI